MSRNSCSHVAFLAACLHCVARTNRDPSIAGIFGGDEQGLTIDSGQERLVVVCNGYADERPAVVGVRPGPTTSVPVSSLVDVHAGKDQAFLHPNEARGESRTRQIKLGIAASTGVKTSRTSRTAEIEEALAAELGHAIWSRPLAYGTCEEFHVDLRGKVLFFVRPDGLGVCDMAAPTLEPFAINGKDAMSFLKGRGADSNDEETDPADFLAASRVAAVVAQISPHSPTCTVHAAGLHALDGPGASSTLAVLDAYVRKPNSADPEEVAMNAEDMKHGLPPLPPLESDSVIRLEDVLEVETISSEVVASQTLALGRSYKVEPRNFHVVLEEIRGKDVFDNVRVSFRAARTYLVVRIGRGGDKGYPQKLLYHECTPAATPT